MAITSSAELLSDMVQLKEQEYMLGIPNADTSAELLSYFEATIVFLQLFNERTKVQEIKIFLASFERRADQRFYFLFHQSSEPAPLPSDSHSSFPMRFGKLFYGTLVVRKRPLHSDEPAFPLQLGYALSRLCAWLLHTCEQSMFIWSYQQPEALPYHTLSRREREVLTLMCHGHSQEAIAHELCISVATVSKHKQNIYQQLGVHNVRDALHASYHLGLVSFLDELYAWRQ